MSAKSGIEWTDATWNPLTGCAHVSPGCDNCYAAREAATRLAHLPAYEGLATKEPGEAARFTGEVRLLHDRLEQPLRWARPRKIFVNSVSDLFHQDVPTSFIAEVFAVMACAQRHRFQVLTKRPQRMRQVLSSPEFRGVLTTMVRLRSRAPGLEDVALDAETEALAWPLPNVWLGTSIESNRYAFRADHLRQTPAAVRWISAEPLLGPLDRLDLDRIDWLVVGGESGHLARPCSPEWVRSLLDRCLGLPHPTGSDFPRDLVERRAAGLPAFSFKQWGEYAPLAGGLAAHDPEKVVFIESAGSTIPVGMVRVGKKNAGRHLDGRLWDEYPVDESGDNTKKGR